MIRDTRLSRRFCQATVHKNNDTFMGTLVANSIDAFEHSAYIAYDLLPQYWGKGVMQKAIRKFIPMIQSKFSLRKIYAKTVVDNKRSRDLLERLGFVKQEEFEYSKTVNNSFVRACLYSLDL